MHMKILQTDIFEGGALVMYTAKNFVSNLNPYEGTNRGRYRIPGPASGWIPKRRSTRTPQRQIRTQEWNIRSFLLYTRQKQTDSYLKKKKAKENYEKYPI